jgi:hypothetical protein
MDPDLILEKYWHLALSGDLKAIEYCLWALRLQASALGLTCV